MMASTPTPSSHYYDFKSREGIFMKALKALEPDQKSHMVALLGIGGVGKTMMMEKLKKVMIEKKRFNLIVTVVVGGNTNTIAIQDTVAESLDIDLQEKSKEARAYKLRKSFEAYSDGGKKKILVVLDDVWQFVDLNDIGLSPLPNQGVDFKVLLTSRDRGVCIMMGVEVNLLLHVDVLPDSEAQSFFCQIAKISDDVDLDLNLRTIRVKIVRSCFGVPLFIKTIACTLKHQNNKHVWEDTLSRLKYHDVDDVLLRIFELSYNNLQNEETRSTLLLCGLYPGDFDILREDLVRYGWGLKLFKNVYTIREARNKLNTCIDQLINANFLIESQDVGYVKMHDIVHYYVLDICSKDENASTVGTWSMWPAKDTSESCKRISLTCTGMYEFPRDRKYPNLLLLKLMRGDKSLRFPENFCEEMKKLEVIAYDKMECPLLSRSLQCSSNLRTLCLHRCLLTFDCSLIGDLLNLEVLSFAHCSIQKLPTTIGNLKELKLLDLTGCINLLIDDGVLNNLVKLEELYMRVAGEEAIRFTDSNYYELTECSKNLFALEIEFFDNNALPKNMSFKNLERFKISLGCYLRENNGQNKHSFENTLMLVTDKCELLDSRMHELFEKTEVLSLQVDGINDLGDVLVDDRSDFGDVLVESLHHHRSSFSNLKVLDICECANLKYLFTVRMANGLTKLEHLTISLCPDLETLVDSGNSGAGAIKFQALKFLSLGQLPKLMSLCNAVNVIELPQLEELILYNLPNFTSIYPDNKPSSSSMSNDTFAVQPFLNKEVKIPRLKILKIFYMTKLKEIWPSQLSNSEADSFSILREITVEGCDNLVNLFPSNSMSLLHHLEELKVWNCGSIDVLFNIDLGCVGETMEGNNNLRYIEAIGLVKLKDIWRVKGVNNSTIHIPRVVYIEIRRCESFRNVINMRALMKVAIDGTDGWGENKSHNEMVESSHEEENGIFESSQEKDEEDNEMVESSQEKEEKKLFQTKMTKMKKWITITATYVRDKLRMRNITRGRK